VWTQELKVQAHMMVDILASVKTIPLSCKKNQKISYFNENFVKIGMFGSIRIWLGCDVGNAVRFYTKVTT
jgi:hypothetical protein